MSSQICTRKQASIGIVGFMLTLLLLAIVSSGGETCSLRGGCEDGTDHVDCTVDGSFLAALAPYYNFAGGHAAPSQPVLRTRTLDAPGQVVVHGRETAVPALPILSVAPKTSPPSTRC